MMLVSLIVCNAYPSMFNVFKIGVSSAFAELMFFIMI